MHLIRLTSVFLLWIAACNSQEIRQQPVESLPIADIPKTDSFPRPQVDLQDTQHILGDKILLSGKEDENGLTSPDSILVIGTYEDSLKAVKAQIHLSKSVKLLRTDRYHFPGKTKSFLLFSNTMEDSGLYKAAIPTRIFKIRPNNFSDDVGLSPTDLAGVYQNYQVVQFGQQAILYLIRPLKIYEYARMFTRLIQFDPQGKQRHAITIQDFDLADIKITEKGYILALNDWGLGAAQFFQQRPPALKIIWMDRKLDILQEFEVHQRTMRILSVDNVNGQYLAKIEMHTGCDACEDAFCYFEIVFDAHYQPIKVNITKQPRDYDLDSDNLLKDIRQKLY